MHIHLNTVFRYCNDVVSVRHFCTDSTEPIITHAAHKQFIVRDPIGFTVEVFADFLEGETDG